MCVCNSRCNNYSVCQNSVMCAKEKREVFFLVPTTSQRQARIDKPKPVSIIYREKKHMSAAVRNLLNSRINAKISSILYVCVL